MGTFFFHGENVTGMRIYPQGLTQCKGKMPFANLTLATKVKQGGIKQSGAA